MNPPYRSQVSLSIDDVGEMGLTNLQQSKKTACTEKARAAGQCALRNGDNRPENHLYGNPPIGSNHFRHKLRRKFGDQEGNPEYAVAVVVIFSQVSQPPLQVLSWGGCLCIYHLYRAPDHPTYYPRLPVQGFHGRPAGQRT